MSLTDFGADLRSYLAAQAVGTAGTTLFRGQFPKDVTNAVLLVETGGDRANRPAGSVVRTVQITCRNTDLATALAKAKSVFDLLNEPAAPRTMGSGSKVTYSKAIQPPFVLGQDERQAWRVLCNYEFILAL